MIKQFGPLNEELVRLYTRQILLGLAYLHDRSIVHRDVKGANVLVSEQGVCKLADFGCSKQLHGLRTGSLEASLNALQGSVPWMAPEVIKQSGHGRSADIWSVGATIVEMATASHPWPQFTNHLAALFGIATTTEPPPTPDSLSETAAKFLAECFYVDPERRGTAAALLAHAFVEERDLDESLGASLLSEASFEFTVESKGSRESRGSDATAGGKAEGVARRAEGVR